jgi:hypothetical protein
MNTDIAEVYGRHKNLKLAANELDMKWQTLYVQLRKIGVPVTGDKSRYGSDTDKLAAEAELEFMRLVPSAISMNESKFQAKVDFMVGREKIDVKASKLKQGNKKYKSLQWSFCLKKQELIADFFVCFGMTDIDYKVFLIPGECVRFYQTVSISQKGKSKWHQYEINPNDLAEFFTEIVR